MRSAVEFAENPYGLISALTKISEAPPMAEADRECGVIYPPNPFGEEGDSSSQHTHQRKIVLRLEKSRGIRLGAPQSFVFRK